MMKKKLSLFRSISSEDFLLQMSGNSGAGMAVAGHIAKPMVGETIRESQCIKSCIT